MSANSRLLASAAGAETDAYLYRAFGGEAAVSGSTINALRFGGQVGYHRDLVTRYYVRAREYEPLMGRWMSRDPIRLYVLTGVNYNYCWNTPVGKTDATGLYPYDGPPDWWKSNRATALACLQKAAKASCPRQPPHLVERVGYCIMACETSDYPSNKYPFMPDCDYAEDPCAGIGPMRLVCCRLSDIDFTQFPGYLGDISRREAKSSWASLCDKFGAEDSICGNIQAGIAILCDQCLNKGKSWSNCSIWNSISQGCVGNCMKKIRNVP
jgi:RHS repeat-associated protein